VKQVSHSKEVETEKEINLEEENNVQNDEINEPNVDSDDSEGQTSETEEITLSEEEQKIQELGIQLEDVTERLYRTQADFDNFRRRTKEGREAAAKYKSQSLVEELLPILDNFERALQIEAENEQMKSLLQGMDMVYRQLLTALTNEGVTEIVAIGAEFDPHLHQAVMQVESEEYKPNEVIEVLQKGYLLKDRIIRPALVKVNA
jgi:molecular chaperone GrpE